MAVTLTEFLASRSPTQIAAILTARPDAAVPPVPRHLPELAERLEIFGSVAAAVQLLPAPAMQVIEVLQLLGPGAGDRAALAGWLGRDRDDPALAATLELLGSHALAWTDDQTVHLAAPLYEAFRYPLQLGAPAAALLARYPVEQLRPIARTLALPAAGRKPDLIAGITGLLTDPERVRELVAGATPAVRGRLLQLAVDGPAAEHFAAWYGYHQPDPELRWAAERGLVLADSWGVPQLPREAAVALRGPGWHAPFHPQPRRPALVEVADDAVEREAAAAGGAAVEQLTTLLEAVSAAPVTLLKAGGVGVKELRRLARTVGIDELTVRLWLELAHEADLIASERSSVASDVVGRSASERSRVGDSVVSTTGPERDRSGAAELLPTTGYDEWGGAEPAERLATVLPAWLDLATTPLLPSGTADRKPAPALVRDHEGQLAAAVRHQLLQLVARLPAGHGVAHDADLAEPLRWLCPLLAAQHPDFDQLVATAWREAQQVGVVAHGALTSLGQALVGGPDPDGSGVDEPGRPAGAASPTELAAACHKLLPAAAGEVVLQADLTALVPGTPARPLAELLDAAADRESRGGAVTWRFTPGSVRRALDSGYPAERLLAELRGRSVGGTVPQPLAYLVNDLARRHGAVRARAVACVLRADDPALLAELAGARALRELQLSVIAPTVLGSARPVAETLAALRAAGYAPVAESADGTALVERVPRRRAGGTRPRQRRQPGRAAVPRQLGGVPRPPSGGTRQPGRPAPEPPLDPLTLAGRLLAARVPAARAEPRPPAVRRRDRAGHARPDPVDVAPSEPADVVDILADWAGHLAPGERRLLAHAIETDGAVTIGYTNAQGNHTTRVIDSVELDGAHLIAWCHLRDDERMFSLHRIDTVAPAP
ncbi:MAG: hypothetical protein GEV12_20720 [Micromonosporaceae bacterium]|nr:hypothetical protein [Micromonosporaceae bacterium]